jgi:exodeoxyribonuclease-3
MRAVAGGDIRPYPVHMHFRLATWNINSVRLRLDLIERFVRAYRPDVLCLQEIKCEEDQFPLMALQALGFPHIAVAGQKGYHGVATLSRLPFTKAERRDVCGRGQARHLAVALEGSGRKPIVLHNLYVPAGGDIPDAAVNDKFQHKLDFLDAMTAWFGGYRTKARNRMILTGDLNVAPASHRCLVPQATPEGCEPYAARDRAARAGARRP